MEVTLGLRCIFCTVFVCCIGPMTSLSTSSRGTCTLGADTFQVGATWHPILEPSGEDRCTTCRCNAPGHLTCDRLACPELHCENTTRMDGSCCPVCAKQNSTAGSPSSQEVSSSGSSASSTKNYCRFQGREYYEGETFPGEQLFTGKADNDCVQCTCSGGRINCDRTCPDPGCPDPVMPEGSCCPVCNPDDVIPDKTNDIVHPAAVSMSDDISVNNFPPLLESGSEHPIRDSLDEEYVCNSGDETYYHGEKWHPRLHPFGLTRCVICTCKLGVTECERIQCSSDDELPCDNPVYVRGKCCKVCLDDTEGATQAPLCLDELETHLFYAYQPLVVSREGAEHVVMYAVEDVERGTVRIAQWEINYGEISAYMAQEISAVNFQRATITPEQTTGRFALIGATTKQRYKKLLKREAKLERRCRGECLENILKLTKVLRVTEVQRSLNCSQSETIVTNRRRSISI